MLCCTQMFSGTEEEGFEFVSFSQLKPVSGPTCSLAWVLSDSSVVSPVLFLNLIKMLYLWKCAVKIQNQNFQVYDCMFTLELYM